MIRSESTTFSQRRLPFVIGGVALATMMLALLAMILVGLFSGRERQWIEYIVLDVAALFVAVLAFMAISVALLCYKCVISMADDTVQAGWYLFWPVHVQRYTLSEFGAVTLTHSGSPAFGRDAGAGSRDALNVCLIRGGREDAARLAASSASPPSGILLVKSVQRNVESARCLAAEVSKLTRLPFGHPTLGPDAPDPAMEPLDLEPSLCLRCAKPGD